MSENGAGKEEYNGNSALDWEIFDILCRDELGLNVSFESFCRQNSIIQNIN